MLLPQHLLTHGVVVEGDVFFVIVLDGLLRHVGPVKHHRNVQIRLRHAIDALVHHQAVRDVLMLDVDLAHDGLRPRRVEQLVGDAHPEDIAAQSPEEAALRQVFPHGVGDKPQRVIAEVAAEDIVDQLEIVDIQIADVIHLAGIVPQGLTNPLVQPLAVVGPRQGVMGGVVLLVHEGQLLLGLVPHAQKGTHPLAIDVDHAVLFQRVIPGVVPLAQHPLAGPLVAVEFNAPEHVRQAVGAGLVIGLLHRQQAVSGAVRPDTVVVDIKEEKRLGHLRSDACQHPVQQPQGPVVQRKIVNQQSEYAEAHHGAVDGRAGKDVKRLPHTDHQHREEYHGVTLMIDARRTDQAPQKDQQHSHEYAVVQDSMKGLAGMRNHPVKGRAIH